MSNKELGLSFRSQLHTPDLLAQIAKRYGQKLDYLGVYDDLGDLPPILPLIEAARYLPPKSQTRLGVVGFAVPKIPSLIDNLGYITYLQNLVGVHNPERVIAGFVPGAWMSALSLPQTSLQQMREVVESFRYLQQKRKGGYHGKHYQIAEDFTVDYETFPDSQILIGAWGPKMLSLAGEIADEIKIGGSANPGMIPFVKEQLIIGANKSNRQKIPKIAFGSVTVVDDDRDTAIYIAKMKALDYIDVIGHLDQTVRDDFPDEFNLLKKLIASGNRDDAVRLLPDELSKRFVVAGDSRDVIEQIEKLLESGVDRFEFGTPHGIKNPMTGITKLVEEVIPYFK